MEKISGVPGLFVQKNIITEKQELDIVNWLDTREWSTVLPRRTQHFGYNYGYKSRHLTPAAPFTGWVSTLAKWLNDTTLLEGADQCIVNEYTQRQKIGKHIDKTDLFGPRIVSISISGDTNFVFRKDTTAVELYVPRRSVMIMTGEARYHWTHEIPGRVTVTHSDGTKSRKPDNYRRISLTFRKTINQ